MLLLLIQELLDFYQPWPRSYRLHQSVGQKKKVPFDGFTSVCLIKVDLSQQAGPYMIIARFLFACSHSVHASPFRLHTSCFYVLFLIWYENKLALCQCVH